MGTKAGSTLVFPSGPTNRHKFRQKKGGVLVAFVTPVQEFGGALGGVERLLM